MSFFDTHAHLLSLVTTKRLEADVICNEMWDAEVCGCFNILLSEKEARNRHLIDVPFRGNGLILRHIAGIHPHDAAKWDGEDRWIRAMNDEIVAIGEIGMDFHYRFSSETDQIAVFRRMVTLALDLGKPVVIHGREAEESIVTILGGYPLVGERVLFHCYTGTKETARRIFDRGWSIGITGIVTFPHADDIREIVRMAPPGHLCFETDAPYLAPVPHRGKINRPAYVAEIYRFVSSMTKLPVEEWVARAETCVRRVFGNVL